MTIALAIVCASAAASEWSKVTETEQISVELQRGSVRSGTSPDGRLNIRVFGRTRYMSTDHIELGQFAVAVDHCKAGRGQLALYKLDGKPNGTMEFVAGAGNVASNVADAICRLGTRSL